MKVYVLMNGAEAEVVGIYSSRLAANEALCRGSADGELDRVECYINMHVVENLKK